MLSSIQFFYGILRKGDECLSIEIHKFKVGRRVKIEHKEEAIISMKQPNIDEWIS